MPGDCSLVDVGCQVTDTVTGMVGGAGDVLAGWVMTWVAEGVHDAIAFGGGIWKSIAEPQFSGWWETGPYGAMWWISLSVLFVVVLVDVVAKMARSDTAGMVRSVFLGVPAVMVALSAVPWIAGMLTQWTDELAGWVSGLSDANTNAMWDSLSKSLGNDGASGGLALLIVQLVAFAALWVLIAALFMRTIALYVLVAAVPLVLVVGQFEPARKLLVRTIEVTLALIVSKLLIALVMYIGAAGVASAFEMPSATAPPSAAAAPVADEARLGAGIAGTVTMLVAGFAPFGLLAMIPAAESAVSSAGAVRQGTREGRQRAGSATGADRIVSAGRIAATVGGSHALGAAMANRQQQGNQHASGGDSGQAGPVGLSGPSGRHPEGLQPTAGTTPGGTPGGTPSGAPGGSSGGSSGGTSGGSEGGARGGGSGGELPGPGSGPGGSLGSEGSVSGAGGNRGGGSLSPTPAGSSDTGSGPGASSGLVKGRDADAGGSTRGGTGGGERGSVPAGPSGSVPGGSGGGGSVGRGEDDWTDLLTRGS